MKIMVTGAAGFIGAALTERLLARGDEVLGIDNLNDYYPPQLKHDRLARLHQPGFQFQQCAVEDREVMARLFADYAPQRVVHLAAQAGVRYSLENPNAYIDSNLVGFGSILEGCRQQQVEHLVYASSSSVYGANPSMPFRTSDPVDHPLSLYAATKKANELMAHTYSHLYQIPTTGLRFFTVYGPWGRPDMALFKFTQRILAGQPIDVYSRGQHSRDFTYIDDIVEGVIRTLDQVAAATPERAAPYRIYNIGSNRPVALLRYIEVLEQALGLSAEKNMLPPQPGDVPDTYADVDDLIRDLDYKPVTPIEEGVQRFVDWYRDYYQM